MPLPKLMDSLTVVPTVFALLSTTWSRQQFTVAGHFARAWQRTSLQGLRLILPAALLLVTTGLSSEGLLAANPSEQGLAYFESDVRPILVHYCYNCHSRQANKQQGGLQLDGLAGMLAGGDRGAALIPGDVDNSLIVQAIRYADPDLQMPPVEKLPNEAIVALENWIKMGAPAPSDDYRPASARPSDPIAGKSHWAFQPLAAAELPSVSDNAWPRTAVDHYVLAGLERAQLRPVADAAPTDLMRRVSFQLTGLPPSAEHLALYRQSPHPETLAKIVDELLASPRFGERWGRHWLDLARYADSNGLDENFLFREAWRYRNWVIDAVNADMPFDRFLLEQIAGDLLPFESLAQRDRQRIATGFLVIGPKVLLGVDGQRQRMDVADEQIDTIGRAVLGMTVGCARCHDHKFDPLPTADYYALAGILTSTSVLEQRFMLNEQRVMERLVGLGENGESLDESYEAYFRNLAELKTKTEKAKAALQLLQQRDEQAISAKIATDASGFCDEAKNAAIGLDERIKAQEVLVRDLDNSVANPPAIPPRAMGCTDATQIVDEAIRKSGKHDVLGEKIPRGFLSVLCDSHQDLPGNQSGRLQLAQWLTDRNHRASVLTARVLANRVWHHLMGQGIVRTVDNFGRTGEPPSHPELLDFLALRLIDHGWSVKSLVRELVASRTFALSSQYNDNNYNLDPDNRLLWRAHRRRLDPESLRDAALSAAGTLELTPMESTVSYLGDQATAVGQNLVRRRTDYQCRSIFLPVIRNDLPELFDAFDFANPQVTTGARPQTTGPIQALFMLNDPLIMSCSESVARRITHDVGPQDEDSQIDRMYELIVNSPPSDSERLAVQAFMERARSRRGASDSDDAPFTALKLACHALLASSRFQFLE